MKIPKSLAALPLCTLVLLSTYYSAAAEPPILRDGEKAPNFHAFNHAGELWESRNYLPMTCTIVWFYKGDFLPKCIKQAKLFRDMVPMLREKNVQVIGVSGDPVRNHCPFRTTYDLNFTLLADSSGTVADSFGVDFKQGGKARLCDKNDRVIKNSSNDSIILSRGVTVQPWIFVISREGKIIYKNPGCEPKSDIDAVMEFLRSRERQARKDEFRR